MNGIRLQGRIEFFDNYIVAVKSTVTQLVYKHAISTIAPLDKESAQQESNKRTDTKPPCRCTHKAFPGGMVKREVSKMKLRVSEKIHFIASKVAF